MARDETDDLLALLDPYPDGQLTAYAVSTGVNDPTNDDPTVIETVPESQSGLGGFS